MKYHQSVVAAMLLFSSAALAGPLQVQYGPPASPLAWKDVATRPGDVKDFSPSRNILGDSKAPVSVKLVELDDERPYGELARRVVWLARYESVAVQRDSSHTAPVTLSLAFDAATSNLLCAFTDAAPTWARSTEETGSIESRHGWKMYPARYETLRSTVIDALAAMWRWHGVDPNQAGQIVVRPRFNNNELGAMVPREAPSNVWIVEVLGRYKMERKGRALTTYVLVWRDGDLKQLFGTVAP